MREREKKERERDGGRVKVKSSTAIAKNNPCQLEYSILLLQKSAGLPTRDLFAATKSGGEIGSKRIREQARFLSTLPYCPYFSHTHTRKKKTTKIFSPFFPASSLFGK